MKKKFALAVGLFVGHFTFGQVVINELDCDTPGTDTHEFIELKTPAPNTALNGYVLVLFNGSGSGMDSSYFALDLDGALTDANGLLLIGNETMEPFPQLLIPSNIIQNGTDAVAIYQANDTDFPEGTLATTANLIDALVYETEDPEDAQLQSLLGKTSQIDENINGNKDNESIQRNTDGSYTVKAPTPRQLNNGSGIANNPITISTMQTTYNEGDVFDITFTAQQNVSADVTFGFTLDNFTFNTSDFTGNTTVTILSGQNTTSATIALIDDALNEGDEEPIVKFSNLTPPYIAFNNFVKLRVVDNDFTVAPFGTPLSPTFGTVSSTQPNGYYDSLDGLSDVNLRQALQDIIANPVVVRAQTYADVIDILKEADQNPANSNQVWLVYLEEGRAKLDFQTTSNSFGKWNREHTFPRSLGGFNSIEADETANGKDVFWATKADSLRHANSDAHALRAADGPENSTRSNQHYGQYTGPVGTQGSFYGDVARSVLYLEIRYNGLKIVNGFPSVTGQMGDLATLLNWHRNDPPDDYEMHRNNVVYTWQFNRNPFIDQPDLVEYIWGNKIGQTWAQPLNVENNKTLNVKLYPNPSNGSVYIKGLKTEAVVEVFSVDGRKLRKLKAQSNKLLKLEVLTGLYLLKITSENKSVIKKLVVK